jgi:ferritin-like metal-binding protein YciE
MDKLQQSAQEQIERIQVLVKRLRGTADVFGKSAIGHLLNEAADVIEWLIGR